MFKSQMRSTRSKPTGVSPDYLPVNIINNINKVKISDLMSKLRLLFLCYQSG